MKLERLRERVGSPLTAEQLAAEMARLNAAFGLPKDRTPDMLRVLANEWFKALSSYGHVTVHRAIDKVIAESKWWPTIAEVHALCKADDDGWRDALGLKDEPQRLAKPPREEKFAREGRTEAEEIAHRAAQLLAMKRQFPFTPALDAFEENNGKVQAPASQAQWISPELEVIARKHGYWKGAA